MILLKYELKMNQRVLLIWACCVGFINFGCLLLFESLADSIGQMAEAYAQLGNFSTALGLDRMNIATMEGFYATEVALIFGIGGAMFAAMTGAAMLSKEEEAHTAEFLLTLPFGRGYVVLWKYVSMAVLIVLFQVIGILCEAAGFAIVGEMPDMQEYILFHGAQLLMHLEVGSICFLISSICSKKQIGAALGFTVLLYIADMLCRIVPDIENLKYITPYYFANASDIFSTGEVNGTMAGIGIGVTAAAAVCAWMIYRKRDLRV